MSPIPALWLAGLLPALLLMLVVWAASLPTRDASLVDRFWGAGFALVAWVYAWRVPGGPGTGAAWLTLVLVTVWGLRLSVHITVRNWGTGEDPRYAAMRQRGGDGWAARSLVTVFGLQGALLWLISAPLAAAIGGTREPGLALVLAGLLAWLIGFAFEAGGDWQLARFRADPANRGRVMQEGFWRYTRHPNYFGDAMCWWGMFLLAAAVGGWWTVFAPVIMTALLVKVSGVALLEQSLRSSKPGYREYVERTNAFLPGPRRDPKTRA